MASYQLKRFWVSILAGKRHWAGMLVRFVMLIILIIVMALIMSNVSRGASMHASRSAIPTSRLIQAPHKLQRRCSIEKIRFLLHSGSIPDYFFSDEDL